MNQMLATGWWPLVSDGQGWPPQMQPAPGEFAASTTAEVIFFFVAGAAVVVFALPWAIRAAVRSRNYVPLIVLGSGLLCSLLEPMLDLLGHLHWAHNLVPAFTNFGITVPALIPLCYVAFLGLESYFCYFVIRNGAHQNVFFMLLGLGIATDALMETIGINLGVYLYYGVQPFEFFGFPYWWGFINGGSFVTVGAVLAYAVPRLKGAQKLLLLLAAPFGMMVAYFGVGSVHILALNSTIPIWMRWVATAVMMAMMIGWMVILHRLVGRPASLTAPKWTVWRVFAYGKFTPSRAVRAAMWQKMCEEGGVKTGDGLAADPEDPSQALIVGPTFVGNNANQTRASQPVAV
ncbi:Uncharacterised protein [Mycobacteroides abscessus subsp. abscessus]|uniref:Uncharacterized protein n=2 Tax=Mycobacteroides abscessus TaxID=36809 RepID=A0A1U3THC3_9MYCO|nr:hypothetical protein [Mycobacteroides abscessus]EUA71694.1 putative membrane protein [Mycobacteroides abscessus subsp. bolletii 1513]EIU08948.1 hypothetical protein MA5S0304_5373 [Mycobacteroides abscessus 5S-0304]EIU17333.1 hypothetical protein MA5S0421_0182 [Mycobacteroides abscessus 5S-0421]EIU19148.1 hypothetical protein MA5S0422_0783 [Mycobacteroides abscessus 5S-0422]EIU24134.1 hypothetical protein MA5S0817_4928 [Mycobacteroides abscessus 5S-0817]